MGPDCTCDANDSQSRSQTPALESLRLDARWHAWLHALHLARLGGLPYRVFLCVLGLAVAALTVTGVVVWRRKRHARGAGRRLRAASRTLAGELPATLP